MTVLTVPDWVAYLVFAVPVSIAAIVLVVSAIRGDDDD